MQLFSSSICWPAQSHQLYDINLAHLMLQVYSMTSINVHSKCLWNIYLLYIYTSLLSTVFQVWMKTVGCKFRSEQYCMTTEFGSFISFILSCSFSLSPSLPPSLSPPTSILSLSVFFFCSAPPALVPLEKLEGNLGYDENSLRQLREACCSWFLFD